MFLNQLRLGEARVQMRLRTLDFDAGGFLHDPAHTAKFFASYGRTVLRQTAFQIDGLADINQFGILVENKVDAGRRRECIEEFLAEFPVKTADGHGSW